MGLFGSKLAKDEGADLFTDGVESIACEDMPRVVTMLFGEEVAKKCDFSLTRRYVRADEAVPYSSSHVHWQHDLKDGKSRSSDAHDKYLCPVGFTKAAVRVAPTVRHFETLVDGWPMVYHGTKIDYIPQILSEGLRGARNCVHVRDGLHVSFSPSIEYSSHPRYARWKMAVDGYYYQAVLQVRLNKARITATGRETLGHNGRDEVIDPRFTTVDHLEWILSMRDGQTHAAASDCLVAGIMLRRTKNPFSMRQLRWWIIAYAISWNRVPDIADGESICWTIETRGKTRVYTSRSCGTCAACMSNVKIPMTYEKSLESQPATAPQTQHQS